MMAVWSAIKTSGLSGFRLDAEYYQPKYLQLANQLNRKQILRLCDLSYITDGIHASPDIVEEDGVQYLSAKCVKDNNFALNNTLQISVVQHEANRRTSVRSGDVLLTTVGTIGNAAVVQEDMLPVNMDRHLGLIRLHKDSGISPYFLSTFLNCSFGRFQTLRESTGNVQLNLFIEKIKEIKIPILKCWPKVSEITEEAYSRRMRSADLYAEAETLLSEELGLKTLDLSPTLFYDRKFSETKAANRLDAEFFQPKYDNALASLKKFRHEPLEKIARLKKGVQARSDLSTTDIPYASIKDIGGFVVETAERSEEGRNVLLKPHGLVLAITGATIGKVGMNMTGENIAICGDLLGIESYGLPPEYLQIVMDSDMIKSLCDQHITGATNGHLSPDDIAQFPIPIPGREIIREISQLVKDAISARAQSRRLLDEAKTMVEQAILGEQ